MKTCNKYNYLLIYLRRRRIICFRPHARARLSVCLCARLLKNACMDFDEMLHVDRRRDIWTNWLTSEPDPDYSPDAGTGKSENRWSVEVRQTVTSLKASYRSRGALFTPRCCPKRAREFRGSGRLFCTTYGCGATGRQSCQIFGFWPIVPIQNQPTAYGLHRRMITIFPCGIQKQLWSLLTTYRKSYMGFSKNTLLDP